MKVVLTGGGSGGPVAPLLAIAEAIKKNNPEAKFLFIGTKKGEPEKEMIKSYDFEFKQIASGKLRRYLSWQNFLDILRTKLGFFQSIFILKKFKPDLIIGAGGYVSVPVILAGWFLKIPSLIHQQDILPTLSNKILSIFAKKIIVSFEPSLKDFPKNKTIFTGHPVREMIFKGDKNCAQELFNLEKEKPVLVVLGGGTGALTLNNLIWQNIEKLVEFCQVIHLTGRGKSQILNDKFQPIRQAQDWPEQVEGQINSPPKADQPRADKSQIPNYHAYEFLTKEIPDLFAIADVVISRAGINFLAELAVWGKPTIVIPIPDSHQEANARYFAEKNAAIVLNQKELASEKLIAEIKELINNKEKQNRLSENIKKIVPNDACKKIISEIISIISMH